MTQLSDYKVCAAEEKFSNYANPRMKKSVQKLHAVQNEEVSEILRSSGYFFFFIKHTQKKRKLSLSNQHMTNLVSSIFLPLFYLKLQIPFHL